MYFVYNILGCRHHHPFLVCLDCHTAATHSSEGRTYAQADPPVRNGPLGKSAVRSGQAGQQSGSTEKGDTASRELKGYISSFFGCHLAYVYTDPKCEMLILLFTFLCFCLYFVFPCFRGGVFGAVCEPDF